MATEAKPSGTTRRPRLAARVGIAAAWVLILGFGIASLRRATSLDGLPDIVPPFDLGTDGTAATSRVEDAQTFYRRAVEQLAKDEPSSMKGGYASWAEVDDSQLRWLAANRKAMATWLEGTTRERGVQAATIEVLPAARKAYTFCRLANLEAIRLEHEGDLAGSWTWLRANLRASRHSGANETLIDRLIGITEFDSTSKQAIRWSDNPEVKAALLRRALDDVAALDAVTAAGRDWIRNEYRAAMNTLDDPAARDRGLAQEWYAPKETTPWVLAKIRAGSSLAFLYHEPERSRRVIRLVLANWLSACDLPAAERAERAVRFGDLTLFRPSSTDRSPMSLEDLARWFESTRFARTYFANLTHVDRALARDEANRATLIVHLAGRLYTSEHGRPPESADRLVGPYIQALPVGYVAPEPSR